MVVSAIARRCALSAAAVLTVLESLLPGCERGCPQAARASSAATTLHAGGIPAIVLRPPSPGSSRTACS